MNIAAKIIQNIKKKVFVTRSHNNQASTVGFNSVMSRVGYRLLFFRYRCQIDTFKTVPVPKRCLNRYLLYIYIHAYIHTYIHTYTHILYMELMKLQEILNVDKGIAIPVTE